MSLALLAYTPSSSASFLLRPHKDCKTLSVATGPKDAAENIIKVRFMRITSTHYSLATTLAMENLSASRSTKSHLST